MLSTSEPALPPIPQWQVNATRFVFLLIALVMGSIVWRQVLFESAEWDVMRGLAKAMLAALALLSVWGVRYPIQMLPLMLFEIAWKTIWIILIAGRAWMNDKWTPEIEALFFDCIGIIISYFITPWRYVWAKYVKAPMEPLFRA